MLGLASDQETTTTPSPCVSSAAGAIAKGSTRGAARLWSTALSVGSRRTTCATTPSSSSTCLGGLSRWPSGKWKRRRCKACQFLPTPPLGSTRYHRRCRRPFPAKYLMSAKRRPAWRPSRTRYGTRPRAPSRWGPRRRAPLRAWWAPSTSLRSPGSPACSFRRHSRPWTCYDRHCRCQHCCSRRRSRRRRPTAQRRRTS